MRNTGRFALFVLLTAACCVPARAEIVSYSLTFCENLDVLKDPTNQTLMENVSKQSQHSLMMQRTTPYFELRNISESALLTQFSMTIGKTAKNFDWTQLIEASPGVSHTVETVDAVMGGIKSDVLTISFTNFAAGDFVRVRMGLSDDDPGAPFVQDYRAILFDLYGVDDVDGGDTSNNAIVTVGFASGGVHGQLVSPLPDFSMNGQTTATNMSFPGGPEFDHVIPFNFVDSGDLVEIPEPSTVALAICGTVGLALFCRRRQAAAI